jgi:hypothetical protein
MRKSKRHLPSGLHGLYWFLRFYRNWDEAARRDCYRKIAVEKKRLIESGVDAEEVRLLCRHLANLKDRKAETRYVTYKAQGRLF